MSASNAAAKKRRANLSQPPSNTTQSSLSKEMLSPDKNKTGLTLPQVIALVDSRLLKLEDILYNKNTNLDNNNVASNTVDFIQPILAEHDHRFNVIATQISELKEIVLKLQTYTMDVNKSLLEERIHFMNESSSIIATNGDSHPEKVLISELNVEDTELIMTQNVPLPVEEQTEESVGSNDTE